MRTADARAKKKPQMEKRPFQRPERKRELMKNVSQARLCISNKVSDGDVTRGRGQIVEKQKGKRISD